MGRGQGVGDQHPYEHCRPQKSQSSCCRAAAQEPSKIPPGMDRDTWEAEKQHWVSFRIPVLFYLLIFISKTSINAIGSENLHMDITTDVAIINTKSPALLSIQYHWLIPVRVILVCTHWPFKIQIVSTRTLNTRFQTLEDLQLRYNTDLMGWEKACYLIAGYSGALVKYLIAHWGNI